jgi:hypothetical protein
MRGVRALPLPLELIPGVIGRAGGEPDSKAQPWRIHPGILAVSLNHLYQMVWYVIMATMTHRTTFALDEDTIRKLRGLSLRWKVSLAEAVRRAVAQAEAQAPDQKPNPVEMLRQLHDSGQSLDPQKADAYLAQVYEDRKHWRVSDLR